MAAVIAAIGAAFLAGAIALFREHRLQQRQLLIAARVMYTTFEVAAAGIDTCLHYNEWAPLHNLPGRAPVSSAWESYKSDLAGHLTWQEWVCVERASYMYLILFGMEKNDSPKTAKDVLGDTEAMLKQGQHVLYPYCTTRSSAWRMLGRRRSPTEAIA